MDGGIRSPSTVHDNPVSPYIYTYAVHYIPPTGDTVTDCACCLVMPNTHRRRRRDETVLLRWGCVKHNSQLDHYCQRIQLTIWKLTKQTP